MPMLGWSTCARFECAPIKRRVGRCGQLPARSKRGIRWDKETLGLRRLALGVGYAVNSIVTVHEYLLELMQTRLRWLDSAALTFGGGQMELAKPQVDVGIFTNQLEAMQAFYGEKIGLQFESVLPVGGGFRQYRYLCNGSVIKLMHSREPLRPRRP